MDAPPSKAAPTQKHQPPTLVAPKETGVMENVSKRSAPKKQQKPSPSTKGKGQKPQQKSLSTTHHLRDLTETKSEDDT